MKFVIFKKRLLLVIMCMVMCAIMLSQSVFGTTLASVFFGESPRLTPIYSVETDKKQVAITFDTAWGAEKTSKIIEILNEYKVSATFFLVGFWVDEYPDKVKELYDNGIELATHSNTHPDFTTLSTDDIKLELTTSISKIESVVDTKVELFRLPYGAYNNTVMNAVNETGLKTIQWDVDTLDWKGLSGIEICERVMSKVQNGSIILCHNNSDNILDALPLVLERLINAGYELVKVGNLIMHSDYYIDNLGVQRKNI